MANILKEIIGHVALHFIDHKKGICKGNNLIVLHDPGRFKFICDLNLYDIYPLDCETALAVIYNTDKGYALDQDSFNCLRSCIDKLGVNSEFLNNENYDDPNITDVNTITLYEINGLNNQILN